MCPQASLAPHSPLHSLAKMSCMSWKELLVFPLICCSYLPLDLRIDAEYMKSLVSFICLSCQSPWIPSCFSSQAINKATTVCYKPGVILKVVFNSKFQEVVEMLHGQKDLSGAGGSIAHRPVALSIVEGWHFL